MKHVAQKFSLKVIRMKIFQGVLMNALSVGHWDLNNVVIKV